MGRKVKSVMGVQAAAPRITGAGFRLVLVRYALPLLAMLIAIDAFGIRHPAGGDDDNVRLMLQNVVGFGEQVIANVYM